jgi:opacity protein-like surface antigen
LWILRAGAPWRDLLDSNLHLGLAAGAGLEYGITQNLSAKGEWIWIGAGAGNTLKENMVRLGLNWRFGM